MIPRALNRQAVLTVLLVLPLAPQPALPAAATPDPLTGYVGNTLLRLQDDPATDAWHLWLLADGTFIRFAASPAPQLGLMLQTGRADATPQPDGTVLVCLHATGTGATGPGPVCLALAPHQPGDRWTQPDATAGPLRLLLVGGQR